MWTERLLPVGGEPVVSLLPTLSIDFVNVPKKTNQSSGPVGFIFRDSHRKQ